MRKRKALALVRRQAEMLDATRAFLQNLLVGVRCDLPASVRESGQLLHGRIEGHLAEQAGMYFTVDTHRIAPYEGMTEAELADFERDLSVPEDGR